MRGPWRNRQLVRCLKLIGMLQRGAWTLQSLATELGASTRTIRRDLAAIEEIYMPLMCVGGHYRLKTKA